MPAEFPPVEAPRLALRVLMMPRDTNHQGTIFGGIILAHIDQAGYIEARHHGLHRWVTASIDRVDFKAPVNVGEVVEFHTRTIRLGRSSVTVQVVVDAERVDGAWARVTEAQLTMVSVDAQGKSIPFREQVEGKHEGKNEGKYEGKNEGKHEGKNEGKNEGKPA